MKSQSTLDGRVGDRTWHFGSRGTTFALVAGAARTNARTFGSIEEARDLLARFAAEPGAEARLRSIAAEVLGRDVGAPQLRGGDWLTALSTAIHGRRVQLLVQPTPLFIPHGVDRGEAKTSSVDVKPTFVEIVVVWADTGKPIPGIQLEVTVPGKSPEMKKTDGGGRIRYDGIRGGSCRLFGTFKGLRAAQCVECVVFGEVEKPVPAAKDAEKLPPPLAVVTLRQRRVRSSDTLDAIAKSIGMTWQDLAKFNWGTSDPEAVNEHLRDDVGCWKKTADGKNYVFSDFDDPGVIVVPGEWSTEALPTGETHFVQVRRLPPVPRFVSWSV